MRIRHTVAAATFLLVLVGVVVEAQGGGHRRDRGRAGVLEPAAVARAAPHCAGPRRDPRRGRRGEAVRRRLRAEGYRFANGQTLSIAEYPALYDKLGTRYGGDGVTTFALPDLRGRTAVGEGAGVGLTPRTLGTTFGSATSALTAANLPGHAHTISGPPGATESAGAGWASPTRRPSMALNFAVSNTGVFPTEGSGGVSEQAFYGRVKMYAGAAPPPGYLPADGRVLNIAEHDTLHAFLRTRYGGDGQDTFALPDLRGRAVMHTANILDEETGEPVLTRTLGQRLGTEQVTLTVNQMPSTPQALAGGGSTGTAGRPTAHDTDPAVDRAELHHCAQRLVPPGGKPRRRQRERPDLPGRGQAVRRRLRAAGWGFAQGQQLPISQNQALYQILGTTFGGNGVTTFALPDLRAALPVHAGDSAGPGLSEVMLGQKFGAHNVTLTEAELGPHAHDVVPEPAGAILLAVGMAGIAARRSPRRSNARRRARSGDA